MKVFSSATKKGSARSGLVKSPEKNRIQSLLSIPVHRDAALATASIPLIELLLQERIEEYRTRGEEKEGLKHEVYQTWQTHW